MLKTILHTPGGKMRFLKTFFRFFIIVTLCSTFTGAVWGTDCQTNIIQAKTCNEHEGCYNNEGWGKSKCHECPVGNKCPYSTESSKTPQACNNGTYQDLKGQAGCKTCSAGTMTPNDGNAYTSCTKCSTGTTSTAGSSSCTACTNGPSGGTYFGYAANADGSCPWRSSKCEKNQYFNVSTKSCTACDANKHNYLWETTSATNLCWDGQTNSSTVYLCNTSNAQVSFPTGFSSSDIFNCTTNKYTIKVYVKYQNTISYVSEFTYNGTNGGQVTTYENPYISGPINTYISDNLQNKYQIDGNKFYLHRNFNDMSNNNNIGSYLYLQNSTLYLDKSSNVQNLPDGTSLHALVPLIGKEYKVYMISDGYNNGSPSPMFNANTTAVATKKFGDTPSTGVTPDKNKVVTCSFGTGTTTYYGYIADDTAPKYYECKKNSTYFNLISNSSNGSTNMFEPSQDGNDICIGYSMTTCEAGYSCNSCERSACGSGKYQDKTGQSSCKSCSEQTSSKYPKSAEGSNNINSCYLTTTAGKYVKTTGAGEVDCACGGYCPGNTTVYYSSGHGSTTGGRSTCGAGTYNGSTGSTASSACKTTSAGYYATAGSCSQTTVNAGCYGAAGSTNDCPNNCPVDTSGRTVSSNAGSSKAEHCYATCTDKTISNGTATKKSVSKLYDGTTYPACTYDTNCDAGYYGADNVTDPSCASCPDGKYSAANASSCSSCGDGKISNSDKTGCDSCPTGTYSTDSMTTCQPCPKGTYQDDTGQKTCISCQDGETLTTSEPTSVFTTSGEGKTSREECCLKSGITLKDSIATSDPLSLSNVCWKK